MQGSVLIRLFTTEAQSHRETLGPVKTQRDMGLPCGWFSLCLRDSVVKKPN